MGRDFKISDLLVEDEPEPCPGHSWELIVKMTGRFYRCIHCDEMRSSEDPPADEWTEDIMVPPKREDS
jgi:hypothetical protein